MVAYVVVDFSASGTKPVGYINFIDQILIKSELGKDDIVTESCAENGIGDVGPKIEEPPAAPAPHAWLTCSPTNHSNSYTLFEFSSGNDEQARLDAVWLSGVIRRRFPTVQAFVIPCAKLAMSF